LGRFLSADQVIQSPGNLQSYNRYSYCMNSPLGYTDPSGYLLFGLLADDNNKSTWGNVKAYASAAYKGGVSENVRLGGAIQMVGGFGEAAIAAPLLAAPDPSMVSKVVGYGILVNGADNASSGFHTLLTGERTETMLHQGVLDTVSACGASDATSEKMATTAEIAVTLATLRVAGGVNLLTRTEAAVSEAAPKAELTAKVTTKATQASETAVPALENPITAKVGEIQAIDPASVQAGQQTALSSQRIATQKDLIRSGTPRAGGPPQVNTLGIIEDGHHNLRAASELGENVDVRIVEPVIKNSRTGKPVTELPTYGN